MSDILEQYRQKKVVSICKEVRELCAQSSFAAPHGSAWRDCAKAWRKVADDMNDADPELARRAMARAETFEYCANTLETETPNKDSATPVV